MKPSAFYALILAVLLVYQGIALAEQTSQTPEIKFFYSSTCPHCAAEKAFLDGIKSEYPNVTFSYYSIENQNNLNILFDFYEQYDVQSFEQGAVPITFIGEDYFVGFGSNTPQNIKDSILRQFPQAVAGPQAPPEEAEHKPPAIDSINVETYSLPALAITLGVIDGFNVCSLGAILLILSMVLALKSRRLTLLAGGIFILVTAVVYGILILFWHQLFSLLAPWAKIMQIAVGLLMIGGAAYFVKEFFRMRKYGAQCSASKGKIYSKVAGWLERLFANPRNLLVLAGGILLFAAVITIVEFPCSAVVPLVFAGVLAKSQLSTIDTLFYLGIYILFYMLDEIIVFLGAVFTMKIWVASPRFLTWIYLIAAVVLVALGIYYVIGMV